MLQAGRKSNAATVSGITDIHWPPPPPTEHINERAQRVWIQTLSNLSAADMPRESFSLFAVWCCLKVELDDVMRDLAKFQRVPTHTEELKTYKALLRMRTALTNEFGQLSSKLRLTPSPTRLDAHRSSGISNRPWMSANKQEVGQAEEQPREFNQRSSEREAQPRMSNDKPWPWRNANSASAVASESEEQQEQP